MNGFEKPSEYVSKVLGINKVEYVDTMPAYLKKIAIIKIKRTQNDNDSIARLFAIADSFNNSFSFPDSNRQFLFEIFDDMEKSKDSGKQYRILHYGDSQIEIDRISSSLRQYFQYLFAGGGCGLIPLVQPVATTSILQKTEGNWERLTSYNKKYSVKNHGALFAISRLNSEHGSIKIRPYLKALAQIKKYEQCRILFGQTPNNCRIAIYTNPKKKKFYTLNRGINQQILYPISSFPLYIKFSGKGTEVTGISLEKNNGIILDNIPLRGSGGMVFTKHNKKHWEINFNRLKPELFILQFGGNAMRFLKSSVSQKKYILGLKKQVDLLKEVNPNARFLFISPADMAFKQNGKWTTYKQLPKVINMLKDYCYANNILYWNMYRAMGGKNTIDKWGRTSPRLASTDHIHFTRFGAHKISNILINAFKREYSIYQTQLNIRNKTLTLSQ